MRLQAPTTGKTRLLRRIGKATVTCCHGGDHPRGFKGAIVAGLKSRRVVQRLELLLDRFVNGFAVVARCHAPQAGDAINDLLARQVTFWPEYVHI